jgi:hypothetical protein
MEAATREIPRDEWGSYFDHLSTDLPTVEVTVEVDGQDLGAQIADERLLLTGISYDHKDDVLVIGLDARGGAPEDVEHMIQRPQRIYVAEAPDLLPSALDVEDAEGHKVIVRFERPPALPAE